MPRSSTRSAIGDGEEIMLPIWSGQLDRGTDPADRQARPWH